MHSSSARHAFSSRAFTLIELLIVVAIIAILAAIALPNFLEAQTRSKVSRAKSDMRTLATAIEAYAVDYRGYPPGGFGLDPRFRRFRPLTSPVSYLTAIPRDPFDSTDAAGFGSFRTGMYNYGVGEPIDQPSRYILASDGPDRGANFDPDRLYPGYSDALMCGQNTLFPDYLIYDPTNGTISRGDIYRPSDAQQK